MVAPGRPCSSHTHYRPTAALLTPTCLPSPLSIPSQPPSYSSLATPTGGSREQQTQTKSSRPSWNHPLDSGASCSFRPRRWTRTLLVHHLRPNPQPQRAPQPQLTPCIPRQPVESLQPWDSPGFTALLQSFSTFQNEAILPCQVDCPSLEALLSPGCLPTPQCSTFTQSVFSAGLPTKGTSAACPLCPLRGTLTPALAADATIPSSLQMNNRLSGFRHLGQVLKAMK